VKGKGKASKEVQADAREENDEGSARIIIQVFNLYGWSEKEVSTGT